MDRNDIIKELGLYFDIVELVCPHTYNLWKDRSWEFLDTGFLHNLLFLRRDIIKQRMYCNEANQLFSQYINRALSNHDIKSHKFDWVMDMKLTRENVFENKEFYNELFEKHGIDYKI